jgi:hypothetical protein
LEGNLQGWWCRVLAFLVPDLVNSHLIMHCLVQTADRLICAAAVSLGLGFPDFLYWFLPIISTDFPSQSPSEEISTVNAVKIFPVLYSTWPQIWSD